MYFGTRTSRVVLCFPTNVFRMGSSFSGIGGEELGRLGHLREHRAPPRCRGGTCRAHRLDSPPITACTASRSVPLRPGAGVTHLDTRRFHHSQRESAPALCLFKQSRIDCSVLAARSGLEILSFPPTLPFFSFSSLHSGLKR